MTHFGMFLQAGINDMENKKYGICWMSQFGYFSNGGLPRIPPRLIGFFCLEYLDVLFFILVHTVLYLLAA